MFVIVGLGNPGIKYAGTKHNIGFDAVTRISDDYGIPLDIKKHKAVCGKGLIHGQKVILVQPQTYMNASGESVRELVDYYRIQLEKLIIIYDDISLAKGQLRIRAKGSAGGHNGIKSIINHLGTQEFYRIKVGVGDKPKGWDLADYVLSRFAVEEEVVVREALKRTSEACICMMEKGINEAMNQYNKKEV